MNKRYAEVIAKRDKERVSLVRQAQRNWIKRRDAGAKFYVSLFPGDGNEQRRLQSLGGVTTARIDTPLDGWDLGQ